MPFDALYWLLVETDAIKGNCSIQVYDTERLKQTGRIPLNNSI
jgi:hypothetical protein